MRDQPPAQLRDAFRAVFGGEPDFTVRAPGRADLLGSHTDYNQGWVLPLAINRAAWLAVRVAPDEMATVHALDLGKQISFSLKELHIDHSLPRWARYPAGVAWSLQQAGIETPGIQAVLHSDVPVGAGVSSSAAVEVAYGLAWMRLAGVEVERMALAQVCQRAENEFVGVRSGLMDQFASLFGQADHALLFDTRTLDWEALPLPGEAALVIADSATSRELAASAYNQRVKECNEAVGALQVVLPGITALRDVSPEQLDAHQDLIPEPARQRAQHVIRENTRVLDAAAALRAGDVTAFGRLMDDSFLSMRDLFDGSREELNLMWRLSHGHGARLGGRILGAGWGGCLIFLARRDGAEDFSAYLGREYRQQTGLTPAIYVAEAADGGAICGAR